MASFFLQRRSWTLQLRFQVSIRVQSWSGQCRPPVELIPVLSRWLWVSFRCISVPIESPRGWRTPDLMLKWYRRRIRCGWRIWSSWSKNLVRLKDLDQLQNLVLLKDQAWSKDLVWLKNLDQLKNLVLLKDQAWLEDLDQLLYGKPQCGAGWVTAGWGRELRISGFKEVGAVRRGKIQVGF